jgi:hypothetical protein
VIILYIQFNIMDSLNPFLARHKEKSEFNQYWYSKATIGFMANECELFGKRIAFLSTPSIYFSLKDKEIKGNSKCFDVKLSITLRIVRSEVQQGPGLCLL